MKSHPQNVRVLIVEGEPLTRDGIVGCLGRVRGYRVVGTAADARKARELCAGRKPHLIVMDLPVPGAEGFGLVRELLGLHEAARIVVIHAREDRDTVERAMHAGARGFVRRADEASALREACATVLGGKLYVSPAAQQSVFGGFARGARAGAADGVVSGLTERELEVFTLMGEGHGPKEIAGELGISVKTEETHQRHIREKLHVRTTGEVRRKAKQWVAEGGANGRPALAGC